MKDVIKNLKKLSSIKRRKHHPLIYKFHKKYSISKKTLFYVKEYGPHSNIRKTIIKESLKILLFASVVSSLGGLALEHIKTVFVSLLPLIILLPVLNDMIGDYGVIISSKFATMLHEGKIKNKWYKIPELKRLFIQILIISTLTAVIGAGSALTISFFSNYPLNNGIIYKILLIGLLDTLLLVSVLFLIAVVAGLYFYKKKEDPNNFLIPITTSIADFGNMIILSVLVILFF